MKSEENEKLVASSELSQQGGFRAGKQQERVEKVKIIFHLIWVSIEIFFLLFRLENEKLFMLQFFYSSSRVSVVFNLKLYYENFIMIQWGSDFIYEKSAELLWALFFFVSISDCYINFWVLFHAKWACDWLTEILSLTSVVLTLKVMKNRRPIFFPRKSHKIITKFISAIFLSSRPNLKKYWNFSCFHRKLNASQRLPQPYRDIYSTHTEWVSREMERESWISLWKSF